MGYDLLIVDTHFNLFGQFYYNACLVLIDDIINNSKKEDWVNRQRLVPVIFNMRHSAEMFFKCLIIQSKDKISTTDKDFRDHDLLELIKKYNGEIISCIQKKKTPQVGLKNYKSFADKINAIACGTYAGIQIFDTTDKQNTFFRYPQMGNFDKYKGLNEIDYSLLKEQIKELYFSFQSVQLCYNFESFYCEY